MTKSPDAFRTISEVAEWLEVPAHVLRFWESRFTQVRPVKRAGGRRYYRPADMELLGGIKRLLHDDGLTIRGVQKLLREEGVRHVAGLCPGARSGKERMDGMNDTSSEPKAGEQRPDGFVSQGDRGAATGGSGMRDADAAGAPQALEGFDFPVDLVTPRPAIIAGLLGLDAGAYARAGIDAAAVLARAQSLAHDMDGHG